MMSAKVENNIRRKVYRRDGWRCALCDSTDGIQIHHILHRSRGGGNAPMNLITLCWRCHAVAHGTDMGYEMTTEDMEQAIVEYLSDLYAEDGIIWNPYGKF